MAIQSFRCTNTESFFHGNVVKAFKSFETVLSRKLAMLHAAVTINDLRSPPGNRLELLVGNRAGQHSIRINDQFRICFVWTTAGPTQVEVVDYH